MVQDIYIIDDDESSILVFKELFKEDTEYKFISVKSDMIEVALKNIPSMIIINEDAIDMNIIDLCKKIRNDDDNTITPVIVVSSNDNSEHRIKILQESIEYYIKKPVNEKYLYYTVKNVLRLLAINRRISPLTGLPGNVQIHAELKKRLANKEPFSVLYVDLDNFKAYNDVYGFLKGDEIIKFTAEVIVSNVHQEIPEGSFVGHIGGDDFVAIIPTTQCDKICQDIISTFDTNVLKFFTPEDIERGYIEVANRKGIIEQVYSANSGHPGGSLSAADILTELYFEQMDINKENVNTIDRDRFVLSKGHASPLLYATLAEKGFIDMEDLKGFRHIDSKLQGHPNMNYVVGVDMSTGSLGQGISCAVGMALANKLDENDYRIYTVLGDGECQEGQVWEATIITFKLMVM